MAQWAPWLAPAVRWVAWAHPAPWVDLAALKWVALVGKWVLAQLAFNLALADRLQVFLLSPLRLHVDHHLCERL